MHLFIGNTYPNDETIQYTFNAKRFMKAFIHTLACTTIAVVALLLTSTGCSQTEVLSTEETAAKVIRFQPVMEKAVTRAPIMTMDYMKDFRVVSLYSTANRYFGRFNNLSDYLFDRVIVSKADDGTWTYYPPMLWPGYIEYADFYAWSPARSPYAKFISHPDEGGYSDGYGPYLHYTVPADINPNGQGIQLQEDLLISRQESIESADEPIALHFYHALSRVVFRARSETPNLSYYIKEVTLCNVYSEATLYMLSDQIPVSGACDYDNPAYGDNYFNTMWENHENFTDYTVSLPGDGAAFVPYTADPSVWTDLHPSTNALMVIPQRCDYTEKRISDVKIDEVLQVKVVYNVGGGDPRMDRTVYLNVCKPGTLNESLVFEMGRQYNFDITLVDAVPTFSLTMSDWNTTPPDVPVPARTTFAVGDQFNQAGMRGVVSEVNEHGAATKVLQIVPMPKIADLGKINSWSTGTGTTWDDLLPVDWYRLWDANASEAQKAFSLVTDPSLNASIFTSTGTNLSTQLSALRTAVYGTDGITEIITKDEGLIADVTDGRWYGREMRRKSLSSIANETLFIMTTPGNSTNLTGVSYITDDGDVLPENIGVLIEKVFDVPVYKVPE
jgi:hypothetical protein